MVRPTAKEVRARPHRDTNFDPLPLPERRRLVPIKPDGSLPPLFLVHGWFGEIFHFKRVAERLRDDIPLYGFEAKGIWGDEQPENDLPTIAAGYIRELREVQPHGPHLLGGFSLGGLIAWEMARQLAADGDPPHLLSIDVGPWVRATGAQPRRFRRLRLPFATAWFHWRNWSGLRGASRGAYARQAYRDEMRRFAGILHLDPNGRLFRLALRAGRRPPRGHIATRIALNEAMSAWDYQPYPYPFTLFRGKIQWPLGRNLPLLGFTPELAPAPVEVRHLPGHHGYIFVEPHVNELVAELEDWVDRHAGQPAPTPFDATPEAAPHSPTPAEVARP